MVLILALAKLREHVLCFDEDAVKWNNNNHSAVVCGAPLLWRHTNNDHLPLMSGTHHTPLPVCTQEPALPLSDIHEWKPVARHPVLHQYQPPLHPHKVVPVCIHHTSTPPWVCPPPDLMRECKQHKRDPESHHHHLASRVLPRDTVEPRVFPQPPPHQPHHQCAVY
ncbi:hypothetical protein Pelo_1376 [Pelomyxa schiedti]|nr:hypothetical protein Pelo_1376 [Pelomyxa schiedti]